MLSRPRRLPWVSPGCCVVHWHTRAMADSAGTGETDGERLFDSVREALLGYPDLGSRPRVSVDQWNGLSATGKGRTGTSASLRSAVLPPYRAVAGQLRVLGQLRYESAVAVLIGLWEDCPVEPIRIAAAHALFSIGTGEAREHAEGRH